MKRAVIGYEWAWSTSVVVAPKILQSPIRRAGYRSWGTCLFWEHYGPCARLSAEVRVLYTDGRASFLGKDMWREDTTFSGSPLSTKQGLAGAPDADSRLVDAGSRSLGL